MRTILNWKLTKDEARKILAHCRADKDWNVEELLNGLNSGKYDEILLNTYAKIVGKDRNYSIMTYAEDANDGYYPMTVIDRLCPYETLYEQEPKYLVAHNKYDDGYDTCHFKFENGYEVKVSYCVFNKRAVINRKKKSKWMARSIEVHSREDIVNELNRIKNL